MRRPRLAFGVAAAVVAALDQLTKQLALWGLDDGPVELVGPAQLRLTFNDGAAFSFGAGRTTSIALVASAIALVILVVGLRSRTALLAAGYGIVFGGAVGNLLDRAFRAGDGLLGGRVVDFVEAASWWPVFNVADASLWVGIAVLLFATAREPAGP